MIVDVMEWMSIVCEVGRGKEREKEGGKEEK
jgi:hypothetical protein